MIYINIDKNLIKEKSKTALKDSKELLINKLNDDFGDFIYDIHYEDKQKEVIFDLENNEYEIEEGYKCAPKEGSLLGIHELENGLNFIGIVAGGDWEYPLFYIIYVNENKEFQMYIPKYGNTFCIDTMTAFGSEEERDINLLNLAKSKGYDLEGIEIEEDFFTKENTICSEDYMGLYMKAQNYNAEDEPDLCWKAIKEDLLKTFEVK